MLALLRLVPSAAKASSTPARGRSSGTVRPLVLLELYRLTITGGARVLPRHRGTRRFPADVAAAPLLWRGGEGGGARGVYARASPSPFQQQLQVDLLLGRNKTFQDRLEPIILPCDFIREIPMLRCEVHASIGTWDDKWIWVISRFVKLGSTSSRSPKSPAENANPRVPTLKTPAATLKTPARRYAQDARDAAPPHSRAAHPKRHAPRRLPLLCLFVVSIFRVSLYGGGRRGGDSELACAEARWLFAHGATCGAAVCAPRLGRSRRGMYDAICPSLRALYSSACIARMRLCVPAHRSWSCALCFMHYALRVSACAMLIQHTVRGSPTAPSCPPRRRALCPSALFAPRGSRAAELRSARFAELGRVSFHNCGARYGVKPDAEFPSRREGPHAQE
ncbi:hypothetical protein FB451DRAFT_1368723 [Mycena latifolia]|nr:hypothetical protein FB451DRAFT_1368723 [Mycena latifolia]